MKKDLRKLAGFFVGATVILVVLPSAAEACSRCFGIGIDNATTRGISVAMFGLLAMLGVVWGGIGMFFYNMTQRSKRREAGDWEINEYGQIESHTK